LHVQGAHAGAEWIVVMRLLRSEHGHDGVADEFLERTAEPDHGLAEDPQRGVDPDPHLLRVELVDQPRIAHDVGEEGGHHPAIPDVKGRRGLKVPATDVAEARSRNRR
jgi:hypothetical protein